MKCINCEMEWSGNEKITASITKCPFCGENPLVKKEAPKFYETSKDALAAIRAQFGEDKLLGKLNAIFPDIAPSVHPNIKGLVYAVYEKGSAKVLKENLSGTQEDRERAVKIAIRNLTEAFIAPEMAENIIHEFTDALGWKIERTQTVETSGKTDKQKAGPKEAKLKHDKSPKKVVIPASQADGKLNEAIENYKNKKYNLAVPVFSVLAEQGNADAQYWLYSCYCFGYGVSQNDTKKMKWLRKAAEQEHATAQYYLGINLEDTDFSKAVEWYQKAVKNGNADAQHMLNKYKKEGKIGASSSSGGSVSKPSVSKPLDKEKPPTRVKAEYPSGFGKGKKALIVDDSMFIAKQMEQILTSEGFEVKAIAADGAQGVNKYKELHPNIDIVMMDLVMPVMDGVAALEKITEFDKNARVVMVGTLEKTDIIKKCLFMGAKSYAIKPLDPKLVLNRVYNVIK